MADGTPDESVATAGSSISITREAVRVSSGSSCGARGRLPVFTFVGLGARIKANRSISAIKKKQSSQGVAAIGDPGFENVSSPTVAGSPRSVYRPEWGVTNGSLLDTPEACQDLVDHAAPPGYFAELRHMHNEDFLGQYNMNLARQVARPTSAGLIQELEKMRIVKGMSEGLKHGVEHGHAQQTIESLEAYDPKAEAKFAAALQSLKDLKLPLLD
nr:hypothetical protein [Tanacetum cinerariifolium]